jgi:hypothetical protein
MIAFYSRYALIEIKPKYRNFSDMQKYQLLEAGQICRCVGDIKGFIMGGKFP